MIRTRQQAEEDKKRKTGRAAKRNLKKSNRKACRNKNYAGHTAKTAP